MWYSEVVEFVVAAVSTEFIRTQLTRLCPTLPPFLLSKESLNRVVHNFYLGIDREYSLALLSQQACLSEAYAALERGESLYYLKQLTRKI